MESTSAHLAQCLLSDKSLQCTHLFEPQTLCQVNDSAFGEFYARPMTERAKPSRTVCVPAQSVSLRVDWTGQFPVNGPSD